MINFLGKGDFDQPPEKIMKVVGLIENNVRLAIRELNLGVSQVLGEF